MARVEGSVILYAADLDELRGWVGSGDQKRFQESFRTIRQDEDAGWEPDLVPLLERLLRRIVFEGKLYEGLLSEEQYYLTQLLVDLFDEYVDPDALSEDLPLDRLVQAVDGLPDGSEARRLATWLVRGRELNGDRALWEGGAEGFLPAYLGYVTREEAPRLVQALDAQMKAGPPGRSGSRPSGLLKALLSAAEECARAELDLVSFIG
jgi:hypothetical protein